MPMHDFNRVDLSTQNQTTVSKPSLEIVMQVIMNNVLKLGRLKCRCTLPKAFSKTTLSFMIASSLASSLQAAPYLLGSQDKLKITVYEWRASTSNAYEWAALSDEFTVSASGDLSLPLLGEVPASGKTTSELASTIAELLKNKIGLSKRPDASVEVSEYRPFYILGLVSKPGPYPYRPDMSVLQAISAAGGMSRLTDLGLMSYEREALVSRGDLRLLNAERLGLLAKRARLEAELQEAASISFPPELSDVKNSQEISRILKEEGLLFSERRNALRSQEEAISQTKLLLTNEIEALKSKSQALQRQQDLVSKQLNAINTLMSKGLTITSRQLSLDQTVSQFESNRLDVNLLILRAQQDLSKADRDILDIKNRRRNEILTETADVRAKLSANQEKSDTSQALIYNSEVKAPQMLMEQSGEIDRKMTFIISRNVDGHLKSFVATEGDSVEPGDTLKIEKKTADNGSIPKLLEPKASFLR